jgi:hypothetical protein
MNNNQNIYRMSHLIRPIKNLLWVMIIMGLIACSRSNYLNKYIKELPDSTLINDAISFVVQIDSLDRNYKISKVIMIPSIYKWMKMDNDSIPPPPPIPNSISYDEIYSHFNSEKDIIKMNDDSIFIKLQTDTLRKYHISNELSINFDNTSSNFYIFYLPIFSFDKQYVFIQYWRHCGSLCGSCHQILLRKVGSKWIKVDEWGCGVS